MKAIEKKEEDVQIVWFKRDLRLKDHLPLQESLLSGKPLLLIYIFETNFLSDEHTSHRHVDFIKQSIDDLNEQLSRYGGKIHCFQGHARDVFKTIAEHIKFSLRSHTETGLRFTYHRDLAVRDLLKKIGFSWHETECNGTRCRRC